MTLILNTNLSIPANTKSYSESLDHVFDRDVMLYSLNVGWIRYRDTDDADRVAAADRVAR